MDKISTIITTISIIVTVFSVFLVIYDKTGSINEIRERWKLRYLRKIFNFKKGEKVLILCSELPIEDGGEQILEKREYIYYRKYGDLDALFECLLSMIKIFPKVNFEICTSAEDIADLDTNIIIIGGPDYNNFARHIIKDKENYTEFDYKEIEKDEIVIFKRSKDDNLYYFPTKSEVGYSGKTDDEDYGYIEKIQNPHCKSKYIFLFGGCHTIGVTGAVKYLSVFSNGKFSVTEDVLENAKEIIKDKSIDKNKFALLFHTKKVGPNIFRPCLIKNSET